MSRKVLGQSEFCVIFLCGFRSWTLINFESVFMKDFMFCALAGNAVEVWNYFGIFMNWLKFSTLHLEWVVLLIICQLLNSSRGVFIRNSELVLELNLFVQIF